MSSLGGSKELMNSKYINSLLNGRWQTFPLNLKNWVRRPPRFKSHPSEECNILLGWHFMLNYLYTCIHIHRFTHEHSHSARTHTHMCILSNTSSGGNKVQNLGRYRYDSAESYPPRPWPVPDWYPSWITNTSFSHCKFKWTSSINFVIRIHFRRIPILSARQRVLQRRTGRPGGPSNPTRKFCGRRIGLRSAPVGGSLRRHGTRCTGERGGGTGTCGCASCGSPIRSREYGWGRIQLPRWLPGRMMLLH